MVTMSSSASQSSDDEGSRGSDIHESATGEGGEVPLEKGPQKSEEDRIPAEHVMKDGEGNRPEVSKNSGLSCCSDQPRPELNKAIAEQVPGHSQTEMRKRKHESDHVSQSDNSDVPEASSSVGNFDVAAPPDHTSESSSMVDHGTALSSPLVPSSDEPFHTLIQSPPAKLETVPSPRSKMPGCADTNNEIKNNTENMKLCEQAAAAADKTSTIRPRVLTISEVFEFPLKHPILDLPELDIRSTAPLPTLIHQDRFDDFSLNDSSASSSGDASNLKDFEEFELQSGYGQNQISLEDLLDFDMKEEFMKILDCDERKLDKEDDSEGGGKD